MFSFSFSRRPKQRPARRRFWRPLVEHLEGRDLLAFNVSISSANTTGMSVTSASGTTTFLATTIGANVNVADIDAELDVGKNVTIDSGSLGLQAGTISTSGITSLLFNNATGAVLTLRSGSGIGSAAGDIDITGLQLKGVGSIILDANDKIIVGGTISATSFIFTAGTTITMPNGGVIQGGSLSMTAGGDIGTIADNVLTSVSQLTSDTSANNGDQFITESNGLTAISLKAGTGEIEINLTDGSVSDSDSAVDVSAGAVGFGFKSANPVNLGSAANPIQTSVDNLAVGVVNNGTNAQEFVTESNGLSLVAMKANGGGLTLLLLAGSIADTDSSADFIANTAAIILADPTAKNFGSAANPIETQVNSLTVNTSAGGGNQFIT